MTLRAIDLFSGIGMFSLGLARTGLYRPVSFSEIDERACAVLARHWPDIPNCGDVAHAKFREGDADVLSAGFPCQDVSLAGPGTGLSGQRSSLIWQALRAVRLVRPTFVILENVAALLSRGMGSILGQLAEDGYDAEWDCVSAFQAGRPHLRKRVFITANAQGIGWGPGRPRGLADGLAGLPVQPCWQGNPIDFFEERFSQPALLGMDDGHPRGLDRLKLCGNALVPEIVSGIGRSLMETI